MGNENKYGDRIDERLRELGLNSKNLPDYDYSDADDGSTLERTLDRLSARREPEPLAVVETNALTQEQEAQLNEIADDLEGVFKFIAQVKDQVDLDQQQVLIPFFALVQGLKEEIQSLLVKVREVPVEEVAIKMAELNERAEALSKAEDKIQETVQDLGYEFSFIESQPSAISEAIPVTEDRISPEVTNESSSNRTSVEANENAAYISDLAEMYKRGDKNVFFDPVKNQSKELRQIFDEIYLVAAHEGFDLKSDNGRTFVNETGRIYDNIRDIFSKRRNAKSAEERVILNEELSNKYNELSESTISFLKTEKVNNEAIGENENKESNPEESEDVDTELSKAATEYQALLTEAGEKAEGSKVIPRIDRILDALSALQKHPETDINVQKNKKNKYLKTLRKEIENFKIEMAAGVPVAEEVAPVVSEAIENPPVENEVVGKESLDPAVLPEVAVEKSTERVELWSAKEAFKNKQLEYQTALSEYYAEQKSNNSLSARLNAGAKKILGLGIEPELPTAIQLMHSQYKELRAVYAASLDSALIERAKIAGNREYSLNSDKEKIAFGKKFILKPNQEVLKLQETSLLSPEMQARLGSVMKTMAKHKWLARAGVVTVAGIAGGLTGGVGLALAGAGWQAGKMTASSALGAGAGYLANLGMQGRVDKADKNLTETAKQFTLADLENFEKSLLSAEADKKSALKTQKIATVAAAVAAGGVTGYSLGSMPTTGVGEVNLGPASPEEISSAAANIPEEAAAQPGLSAEAVNRLAALENAATTEISPLVLKEAVFPYYGVNGDGVSFETVISDIKIVGDFKPGVLSDAQQAELGKFIKITANDSLAAHVNVKESVLETQLLEKLQNKFGAESWWNEAKITKVDIGHMEHRVLSTPGLEVVEEAAPNGVKITTDTGNTYTEAASGTESISKSYTVAKGDTLYEIVEKKFAGDLKDVPADKRAELISRLFEKVEGNPKLLSSLGIKSNDIDLIYPGEKINLTGLEGEWDRLIEREHILDDFRKTAPLSVEGDNGVKNIPITVVEKPIVGGTNISTNNGPEYTEAGSVIENKPAGTKITTDGGRTYSEALPKEVPVPPRPFSINGEYFNHPDYQTYINKSFGSTKLFEQAVERSVSGVDNTTYDFFDRLGGVSFESPYRFLSEMTMSQIAEFEKLPNAEIRSFLQQNNMKYDTYLAWLDQIDLMKETLPNGTKLPSGDNTKLADLFSRYVAETQTAGPKTLIK